MDDILNRILFLLKENKIPKGKFLSDLNFDRSALSEWVKGRHQSYMKRLPEIAEYFDVSLDWLAGNEQKNKPFTEAKGFSQKSINLLSQIDQLSPANRAKLEELCALFLNDQDNKK